MTNFSIPFIRATPDFRERLDTTITWSYQVMNYRFITILWLLIPLLGARFSLSRAGENDANLPFDPARICRLSLDEVPRSISIRQGDDVWIGYDLEKGNVMKVWQAPAGSPGLIIKSFKAYSKGTTWFEVKNEEAWSLKTSGSKDRLSARYLGSTREDEHFLLRWELSHDGKKLVLNERIPISSDGADKKVVREVRVESLEPGEALFHPMINPEGWELTNSDGQPVSTLTDTHWHRLSLP
ncbi:MAG: hypothetical protein P1U89_15630 [Verrucomicrobiales bacterium]|nr:hypothetical protein [Verrucomicrobiales bacterium]